MSTSICQVSSYQLKSAFVCHCARKFFLSIFVVVSTKICRYLSSCPQNYVNVIVIHKKICQCLSSCEHLPFDSNLDTSQPQYLIVLFRIYFPFLVTSSLEFFRPHSLCVSFFSLSTYPFILILPDYVSAIMLT